MKSLGHSINTARAKVVLFIISSTFAAVTGALVAPRWSYVEPTLAFSPFLSFQVVIWGIFGGVATIYGPVAAVFVLYPLTEWLGSFAAFGELRLLIFAVIVLLVLLFMPRGLAPWTRDRLESQCPRCKQRNGFWKDLCRLCGAPLKAKVARAQRLVGHQ